MNEYHMKMEALRASGGNLDAAKQIYAWLANVSLASTLASPSQALAPKRRGRPRKITAQVLSYLGASKNDDAKPKKRKYTKKNTAYWGK